MWNGHAETGLVAGLGWVLAVPPAGIVDGVARVAVTTGHALAPDIDHRNALTSQMWGWPSKTTATLVHRVVGHRAGTHEVAAPVVGGVVAAALGSGVAGPVGVGAVWAWCAGLVLVIVSAYRVVPRPRRRHPAIVQGALHIASAGVYSAAGRVIVSALVGVYAARHSADVWWLGWAVALGIGSHLLGDAFTKHGIPFTRWGEERDENGELVRFTKETRMIGPRIFVTGSWAEKVARRVLQTTAAVLAVAIMWRYGGPDTRAAITTITFGGAELAALFASKLLNVLDAALAAVKETQWIGLAGAWAR